MNRSHLTDDEAAQLYVRWSEKVARRLRAAAVKANGRPERHPGDLADLHRDLVAVDLRGLLEPEPEAQPGTPLQAVAEADRWMAEAAQQHAFGAHKAAIVYLQQACHAANQAVRLLGRAASPEVHDAFLEGPIPPRPPAPARPEHDPDRPEGSGDPGWFPQIPAPRRPY